MRELIVDDTVTLPRALTGVFAHLADPTQLATWLSEVNGPQEGAPGSTSFDDAFPVRVGARTGTGEVIACEPPRYVAYRLTTAASTHVIRVTCTAVDGVTRVDVHQAGDTTALAVDLAQLRRFLRTPEANEAST